jgi:DNA-binding MarR family transcriptional regulator
MKRNSDKKLGNIHPPVKSIRDLLSFKVARFSALNQRLGGSLIKEVFDLSLNDWRILGLVASNKILPFKALQSILYMDKGQLSRSVKFLVQRDYIRTEISKDDARAIDLIVTSSGKTLNNEILHFSKNRNDIAVGCLTKQECEAFFLTLKKVTDHSEKIWNNMQ